MSDKRLDPDKAHLILHMITYTGSRYKHTIATVKILPVSVSICVSPYAQSMYFKCNSLQEHRLSIAAEKKSTLECVMLLK